MLVQADYWHELEEGFLVLDTFGTEFDTTLAVYTESTLAEADANNNTGSFQSEVADIRLTVRETYYIAVDGVGGATGQIDLNWLLYEGQTFIDISPTLDALWNTDNDHDFGLNAAAPADVDGDGDLDLAAVRHYDYRC